MQLYTLLLGYKWLIFSLVNFDIQFHFLDLPELMI